MFLSDLSIEKIAPAANNATSFAARVRLRFGGEASDQRSLAREKWKGCDCISGAGADEFFVREARLKAAWGRGVAQPWTTS